jgi:iron complex outermembrane receptor protein
LKVSTCVSRIALACVLSLPWAASAAPALAQSASQDDSDEIIVTGTRARDRTLVESPVPVDVITASELRASGAVADELGQAFAVLAPSFNFPRQSNSGSSDHVRAGQLRGLSPDQLLVLVNGKRRHTSAIVNTETKIGRGAAAVDFNTIPLGAVRRIEVLRDGAGAQYGSDAIAGVVNVILDDRPSGADITTTYGAHVTDLDPISETLTDGETFTIDASAGAPLGDGFLRFGGDFEIRQETNRAGFDQVPFFVAQTPANLALKGLRNYAEGDPDVEDWNIWFNAETALFGGKAYAFATFGERETSGATFFRYPDSAENVSSVYPNGYRPLSTGDNQDASATAGLRLALSGWNVDTSLTYGRNEFVYGVRNSLNASLGPTSPTSFRSGAFVFDQLTLNADVVRELDAPFASGPLNLAAGVEYRRESYQSRRGDPASFAAGPFDLAIGAQGAPGLTPEDETDLDREVVSLYADLSGDVTSRLLIALAARYEHYSDFDEELTGKIAALYRISDRFRLRGAVSNSFRAPALQQIGFSDATLNFGVDRTLVRTRTVPVSNPIARALGAEDLEPETSLNAGFGAIVQIMSGLSLTVDAFQIDVSDRITLSDRFFGPALEAFVQAQPGGAGVQSVRFFTNAIDTQTDGVDVVLTFRRDLFGGDFTLSGGYTYAQTRIDAFAPTPAPLLALDPAFRLIGVEEINTIEQAAPRSKLVATALWSNPRWRLLGRVSHYGSTARVFNFGGGFEPRQVYGSETQVDAEAEYALDERAAFAIGAANILDEYPDLSSSDINFFGNLPYDILSPIGVNGRYLYARLRVTL